MTDDPVGGDGGPAAPPPHDDMEILLKALVEHFSGKAGNTSLRQHLNWDDDRYWAAHGRAVDQGRIIKGKGRGGSVLIPSYLETGEEPAAAVDHEPRPDAPQPERMKEAELYEPSLEVIESSWAKQENYDEYAAAITARKGSASTGGKWTRPDVALVGIRAFPYLPGRFFDIVTFEIKPSDAISVEGVFEALSHQQFATRSYAVFHIPDEESANAFPFDEKAGARIMETARRHGVGIIVAQDINDWDKWDELLVPRRVEPDPEQANRFIATCFPEPIRDRIIKWHK